MPTALTTTVLHVSPKAEGTPLRCPSCSARWMDLRVVKGYVEIGQRCRNCRCDYIIIIHETDEDYQRRAVELPPGSY